MIVVICGEECRFGSIYDCSLVKDEELSRKLLQFYDEACELDDSVIKRKTSIDKSYVNLDDFMVDRDKKIVAIWNGNNPWLCSYSKVNFLLSVVELNRYLGDYTIYLLDPTEETGYFFMSCVQQCILEEKELKFMCCSSEESMVDPDSDYKVYDVSSDGRIMCPDTEYPYPIMRMLMKKWRFYSE